METAKWSKRKRMLECVSIRPHYCKQNIVNAVIDDHFVHEVGVKGLEEVHNNGIDNEDKQHAW